MVLLVKKNKRIVAISLDKYILLSKVVIIDNLQSIRDICCLPALIRFRLRFLSMSGVHNMHVYKYVGL